MLNRDAILQAQDLPTVVVSVPQWGGDVTLRTLTAAERFAVNEAASVGGQFDAVKFQTTLIEKTAILEDGSPMFMPGDASALAGKSSAAMGLLFTAASRLNGLGATETDAAEKNS